MTSVHELLNKAGEIINQRGENYGGIEQNFQLAADMATLRLGRDFHPYEIAIVLACVKNARNFASPDHMDSHLDGAAYELFAATFAEDYARNATAEIAFKRKPDREPAKATHPMPSNALRILTKAAEKATPSVLAEKLAAE